MPRPASSLHAELARRILHLLKSRDAVPGDRLIEQELCDALGVSRTPVRGALRLLAEQSLIKARPAGGFVLARIPAQPPQSRPESAASQLFAAMAAARDTLPPRFALPDIARRFQAPTSVVAQVLQELAELGLAERLPGHHWALRTDTAAALNESYAFRRALEPQMLQTPGFRLDRAWAEKTRAAHLALRHKPWRAGDADSFNALNADFHNQLARCSGNRFMARSVARQNQLRRFLAGQWDIRANRPTAPLTITWKSSAPWRPAMPTRPPPCCCTI